MRNSYLLPTFVSALWMYLIDHEHRVFCFHNCLQLIACSDKKISQFVANLLENGQVILCWLFFFSFIWFDTMVGESKKINTLIKKSSFHFENKDMTKISLKFSAISFLQKMYMFKSKKCIYSYLTTDKVEEKTYRTSFVIFCCFWSISCQLEHHL